jgi:uncharacterized protein (UPF0332 family)
MNTPTIEESLKALTKSLDAIETAEHDLKGNFNLAAINRIYYACYYCMTALLFTQNVFAKTHQGTRAKFTELFIKTGHFSDDMAAHIKNAFDLRQEADYDFDAEISYEIVALMIVKSKELHRLSNAYLQTL